MTKKNEHLFSEIHISYLCELFKPGEIVDTTMIDQFEAHPAKPVHGTLETLSWEVLHHVAYPLPLLSSALVQIVCSNS